jgi:hypothetical protein
MVRDQCSSLNPSEKRNSSLTSRVTSVTTMQMQLRIHSALRSEPEGRVGAHVLRSGLSLFTQRRRQDLPVRGSKPLDRMKLQSRGPCTRTCSSSTPSSSAVQCPFRTASHPPAASLLPLPPPRRRAPPGGRAIVSTLDAVRSRRTSVPGERCVVVLLMRPGQGRASAARGAVGSTSGGDPTDGFDSQGRCQCQRWSGRTNADGNR